MKSSKLTFTKADFAAGAKAPAAKGSSDVAFIAWSAGTSLKALVQEHGGSRSAMRKRLTAAAGGKEQFRALRAQGAGGSTVPFGGKRAQPRTQEVRAQDDALVPRVDSRAIRARPAASVLTFAASQVPYLKTRIAEETDKVIIQRFKTERAHMRALLKAEADAGAGWTSSSYPTPTGNATRLTDTEGQTYVRARDNEKADVIVTVASEGFIARYKLEALAASTRTAKAAAKTLAHGQARHAVVRAGKRAARKARRHK